MLGGGEANNTASQSKYSSEKKPKGKKGIQQENVLLSESEKAKGTSQENIISAGSAKPSGKPSQQKYPPTSSSKQKQVQKTEGGSSDDVAIGAGGKPAFPTTAGKHRHNNKQPAIGKGGRPSLHASTSDAVQPKLQESSSEEKVVPQRIVEQRLPTHPSSKKPKKQGK